MASFSFWWSICGGSILFPRSGRVWAKPNQVSGGSLTKRQQERIWRNEVEPFPNLLSVLVKTSESRKEPSVRREKWRSGRRADEIMDDIPGDFPYFSGKQRQTLNYFSISDRENEIMPSFETL